MKLLFSLFLLFFFKDAYPRTVLIGSGSGSVVKNNMNGLRPGDTLAIRAGYYDKGGSFSHLYQITIINSGGMLDFGQGISIGNLSRVRISGAGMKGLKYGIRFHQMQGNAFSLEAPCYALSISFCEYRNLDGNVLDASRFFTTYNGDTATLALYKTTLSDQYLIHSGPLFVGSWAGTGTFQNVVDSIAFLRVIVDSTNSNVNQVLGSSIYRMLASDWRITGPCPNGIHDVGLFQTKGNGTLRNIYRHSGWGYLWRIWNVGLNGKSDSYVYNCIDLSSDAYGTVDTRVEAADTTAGSDIPFCRGGNMHILNNTTGNKRNTSHYVTVLAVIGRFYSESGYTLEIRNNLCFNNYNDNGNRMVKQNTDDLLPDTSNNLYVQDPIEAGILLDTVECQLNPSGAAIDRALPVSYIKTDIDGIARPTGKAADIGARESAHPEAYIPPRSAATEPSKKYLYTGLVVLFGAALFLVLKKPLRKRSTSSRIHFQHRLFQEG
jgi:hypothetical protein